MIRVLLFIYEFLKLLVIVVDVLLFVGFLYAVKEGWKYRPHLDLQAGGHGAPDAHAQKAKIEGAWSAVVAKAREGTRDSLKVAIINADKLVDSVLQAAGVEGETVADRLNRLSSSELSSLRALWRAHRLRNEIVHSPDFDLGEDMALQALKDYQAFLKELKLLD